MTDDSPPPHPMVGMPIHNQPDANLAAMSLLNAALTAQIGMLLQMQVPVTDVMNLLIEHVMKMLALVEPEQLRNAILGEIRRNLPSILNRHVDERMRTPGGVFVPPAGARVQ